MNIQKSNERQIVLAQSEQLKLYYKMQTQDSINLFQQYYLDNSEERQAELKFCLHLSKFRK